MSPGDIVCFEHRLLGIVYRCAGHTLHMSYAHQKDECVVVLWNDGVVGHFHNMYVNENADHQIIFV